MIAAGVDAEWRGAADSGFEPAIEFLYIPCFQQGVCRPRPAAQPDRKACFVGKPHGTTVDRGAASFDVKAST